jgi:predicted TIM-barrel fold metal-dependent hydrolase
MQICFRRFQPLIAYAICAAAFSFVPNPNEARGQTSGQGTDSTIKSQLIVPATKLERASAPVVDIHTHFFVKGRHDPELLKQYVAMMDRNNIAVCVSLDGTLPRRLDEHREFLWTEFRDRFVIFANIDFRGEGIQDQPETWACNQPEFVRTQVDSIRKAAASGLISGLKFFKDFGLKYCNADGGLIEIDDPRFDPIWSVCGELGLPVIMHSADPSAFFEPTTPENERYRELLVHPDWSFSDPRFPRRAHLHQARNRVIERHPGTIFIAAHFANDAEDLAELGQWLDHYPNLVIEFASRINELGRQPYSSKRFFEKYQDRIMFGTDGPWPESRLRLYWRFLETLDEYFPYSEKQPQPQGDWRIYGIGLEPEVLHKIYHGNAERLIPGVARRVAKYNESHNAPQSNK